MKRFPPRLLVLAGLPLGALLLAGLSLGLALAVSGDSATVPDNTFTADTLNAPAGLTASSGTTIGLSWTATVDSYAAGYRVLRGTTDGGPYSQIAQVTPRTNTTYTDNPSSGVYYYVVHSYFQNWESSDSNQASATCCTPTNSGYRSPTSQAADTGGDGNGYETNPSKLLTQDNSPAEDQSSGANTTLSCTDSGKDRHRLYNYGFSIPAGSAINGIQVQLANVRLDNATGYICVQLSWDGGTTWTSAKQTANLTSSETTYTVGGTTDTWGRTWSTSDFSNTNLRVRIIDVANNTSARYRLDWVGVQVTFVQP